MNADEREQLALAITANGCRLTYGQYGWASMIYRSFTFNRQPSETEDDFLLAAGSLTGAHIESP